MWNYLETCDTWFIQNRKWELHNPCTTAKLFMQARFLHHWGSSAQPWQHLRPNAYEFTSDGISLPPNCTYMHCTYGQLYLWASASNHIVYLHAKFQLEINCTSWDIVQWKNALLSNRQGSFITEVLSTASAAAGDWNEGSLIVIWIMIWTRTSHYTLLTCKVSTSNLLYFPRYHSMKKEHYKVITQLISQPPTHRISFIWHRASAALRRKNWQIFTLVKHNTMKQFVTYLVWSTLTLCLHFNTIPYAPTTCY